MTGPDPLTREWLVTKRPRGYASGTLSGACTRPTRPHLVAALTRPAGRVVIAQPPGGGGARARRPDRSGLSGFEENPRPYPALDAACLGAFRLGRGSGLDLQVEGALLEKRVLLLTADTGATWPTRMLRGDGPLRLRLRSAPSISAVTRSPVDRRGQRVLCAAGRLSGGYEAVPRRPRPPSAPGGPRPEAALVSDGGSLRSVSNTGRRTAVATNPPGASTRRGISG